MPPRLQRALNGRSEIDLLADRRIPGFEVTGYGAILHTVKHFRGHVQKIVYLTRNLLGERYTFAFVPNTPEQGFT